jgi:Rieske Fe-S protein
MIARVGDVPLRGSMNFSYPRPHDLCIIAQPEEGRFVAYSARCTHLSCPVEYQAERQWLFCPCHNGAFHVDDGRVLQGPPPHALPRIMLEIRGDEIWAVGVRHAGEEDHV